MAARLGGLFSTSMPRLLRSPLNSSSCLVTEYVTRMQARIRHSGVAALLCNLALRAAHVLSLQRAEPHVTAHVCLLLCAIEVRESTLLGYALQRVLELLGVGILKATTRDDVGVI